MKNAIYVIIIAIFIVILGKYFYPQNGEKISDDGWQYSHVRTIDPIDARGSTPDIVAVLTRFDDDTIRIRIDFLELLQEQNYEMAIYIDSKSGGNKLLGYQTFRWDYVINYENSGMMHLYSQNNEEVINTKLRTLIDYRENYLLVTMGYFDQNIDGNASIQIIVTNSTESSLFGDLAGPILLAGSPPPPIEVSFVFWNVLDSSTPATILRSWAGAHTGPLSSRHGLSYLLFAAKEWNIPIQICDYDDPMVTFALNYLQVLKFSNDLLDNGIVNTIHSCNYHGNNISTPELTTPIEILADPSRFVLHLFTQYSLLRNDQLIIGGELSKSILGNPEALQTIFGYIASHPWIRVAEIPITGLHLIEINSNTNMLEMESNIIPYTITGVPIFSGRSDFDIQTSIRFELPKLPVNIISKWAAYIYNMIIASGQANIILSRGSYLSQLGHFIEAAYWVENPREINSCIKDIDWDGQPECILATSNTFLTFELDGGYLAFAFYINSTGVHQMIGPTTQFGVLRSDPSELLTSRGIAGDQGQIIGAFADPISNLMQYQGYPVNSTQLDLVSGDGNMRKSYSIQNNVIRVSLRDDIPEEGDKYQLPLVLDPWLIYTTPLDYRSTLLEDQWVWMADDTLAVAIATNTTFQYYAFNDTYFMLKYPEDPNFDYTPGHHLPIPMALVEFSYQPIIRVDLTIDP